MCVRVYESWESDLSCTVDHNVRGLKAIADFDDPAIIDQYGAVT
jgi:hypothetical protein